MYNTYIHKYDMSGNLINELDVDFKHFLPMPDGRIFYDVRNNGGSYTRYMISQDFQTTTTLPPIQIEVEHGFMEEVDYDFVAGYQNKLYVSTELGLYCLDTDTLKWKQVIPVYKLEWINIDTENIITVGKYLISGGIIFDMEAGQVIAKTNNAFKKSYYGGTGNVFSDNGKWYKIRFAADGSDFSQEPLGGVETKGGKAYLLNDRYYVYEDDYGFFLRTYEKGEEEKYTIWLFE